MQFSKIDLSNLVAISHTDDCLGLIIDRGDSLELIEIPAPLAAYEGLRQLEAIVTADVTLEADFNQLPGVPPSLPSLPVPSTLVNAVDCDPEVVVFKPLLD